MPFPIGYRFFHSDPSFNFELNRWLSVLPEEELGALAPLGPPLMKLQLLELFQLLGPAPVAIQ